MGHVIANVAVINESTVLTDQDVEAAVPALQAQLSGEFAQVWERGNTLHFVTKADVSSIPADYWQMVILDNSDQAGALGYHDTSNSGTPLGKVFAKTDQTYGSSWTVTISHELLEQAVDPECITTAGFQLSDGSMVLAAVEVGDAVEDDSLGYKVNGVLVSDFVYPEFFGIYPHTGAGKYDREGHATIAFNPANPTQAILPAGYLAIWTQAGGWTQVVGQSRVADPHALPPVGSRRERRARGQANWVVSTSWDQVGENRKRYATIPGR